MIIYKDFITGDELLTDTYKVTIKDDVFFEVEGKLVTEKTEVSDAMIGGNASAEGGEDEGAEDTGQSGCNIVLAHRLVETGFSKKDFKTYIQGYMKKVLKHLEKEKPDRVDAFKKGASDAVKNILGSYDDWQFFMGESMNPDGAIVLMGFRPDGTTPYMLYFRDGLIEEKV